MASWSVKTKAMASWSVKTKANIQSWEDDDDATASLQVLLHEAIYNVDIACVKALLDHGADVNACNSDDDLTPLMAAACVGNVECMRLLIERGAIVNYATSDGSTALMAAAAKGHPECVTFLLGCNADASLKDHDGSTAACWATMHFKGHHTMCLDILVPHLLPGQWNPAELLKITAGGCNLRCPQCFTFLGRRCGIQEQEMAEMGTLLDEMYDSYPAEQLCERYIYEPPTSMPKKQRDAKGWKRLMLHESRLKLFNDKLAGMEDEAHKALLRMELPNIWARSLAENRRKWLFFHPSLSREVVSKVYELHNDPTFSVRRADGLVESMETLAYGLLLFYRVPYDHWPGRRKGSKRKATQSTA